MSERDHTCSNCRFWEIGTRSEPEGPMGGLCRKYAPRDCEMFTWPSTYENDWCGEHQPAKVLALGVGVIEYA